MGRTCFTSAGAVKVEPGRIGAASASGASAVVQVGRAKRSNGKQFLASRLRGESLGGGGDYVEGDSDDDDFANELDVRFTLHSAWFGAPGR